MQKKKLLIGTITVLAFGLIFSGCGPKASPQKELTNQLRNRVDQLWQARMDKDLQVIYELQCPEYRDKVSPMEFNSQGGNIFRTVRYEIDSIILDESGKEASVFVTSSFLAAYMPLPKTVPSQESKWILIDDVWYVWAKADRPQHVSGRRDTNVK